MAIFSPINVLFIASEADPLVKVGGLGDVASSLPRALRIAGASQESLSSGLDIRLVIPFHPAISRNKYTFTQIADYKVD